MVGKFVRRVVDLVVVLLALLAFFTVPLGTRTPYQHVRSILGTEEAASTGRDIVETGRRLMGSVQEAVPSLPSTLSSVVPKLGQPAAPAPTTR